MSDHQPDEQLLWVDKRNISKALRHTNVLMPENYVKELRMSDLDCIARPLDIKAAKEMIARRGRWVRSK